MTATTVRIDDSAQWLVRRLGARLRGGTLVVHDGEAPTVFGSGDPFVEVTVHDARAYRALLRGSNGLTDAYIKGWWSSTDLTSLFRVLASNVRRPMAGLDRIGALTAPLVDPVARMRRSDKATDRRNVRRHYDIGNDFYALMLDPTMTYSCALFDRPGLSLEQAQVAKLERLCSMLGLSADDHLVEIGTGWGGLALHAATGHGCRVTTTTISAAQHDHATKKVADAGLTDRITVLESDYRDLAGTYDKLISVEMIEAVSWRDHQTYFDSCARLLRSGGRAALQAIVIDDSSFDRAKHHDDFVRRAIFPGGCLPSLASIRRNAQRAGLHLLEMHDIGDHYPPTLRAWRANVQASARHVRSLGFDDEFLRLWDLYLTYCEAGFLERHITDVQLLFERR